MSQQTGHSSHGEFFRIVWLVELQVCYYCLFLKTLLGKKIWKESYLLDVLSKCLSKRKNQRETKSQRMTEGTKTHKKVSLVAGPIKKRIFQLPKLCICTKQAEQEPLLFSAFGYSNGGRTMKCTPHLLPSFSSLMSSVFFLLIFNLKKKILLVNDTLKPRGTC